LYTIRREGSAARKEKMRLKKAKGQKRIAARIKDYEETVERIRKLGGDAKGYHKPGSAKHW